MLFNVIDLFIEYVLIMKILKECSFVCFKVCNVLFFLLIVVVVVLVVLLIILLKVVWFSVMNEFVVILLGF